jgi:hypothetical protein
MKAAIPSASNNPAPAISIRTPYGRVTGCEIQAKIRFASRTIKKREAKRTKNAPRCA